MATDAVAVAVCAGMTKRPTWGETLRMSSVFGIFQAAMPAIGYAGGAFFHGAIAAWDHWIAFGLLAAVGIHMIAESRETDPEIKGRGSPFSARRLLVLGFATSVDALAVGLSFALMGIPPLVAVLVIGATTFVLCVPALRMGARLGIAFAHRAEFVGGVVLVAIGVRILIEHLSGAA